MTEQQRRASIAALVEERRGYEESLALAEEEADPEAIAKWTARIDEVNRCLVLRGADDPPGARRSGPRTKRKQAPTDPTFV